MIITNQMAYMEEISIGFQFYANPLKVL
jgi:hypothetical protein